MKFKMFQVIASITKLLRILKTGSSRKVTAGFQILIYRYAVVPAAPPQEINNSSKNNLFYPERKNATATAVAFCFNSWR